MVNFRPENTENPDLDLMNNFRRIADSGKEYKLPKEMLKNIKQYSSDFVNQIEGTEINIRNWEQHCQDLAEGKQSDFAEVLPSPYIL